MSMKFILGCRPGQPSLNGMRVAVIGAGVAGLGAAGFLYCRGYSLDVYDMMPEAGGMLMFGIPEERIPKRGVLEGVLEMRRAGVNFSLGKKVDCSNLEGIAATHDAVIVSTGTWSSRRLNVSGCRLEGITPALEFLVANYMHALGFSDREVSLKGRVAVIGGGYTAVDAAVESLKWTSDVDLYYRRTISESSAKHELSKLPDRGIRVHEQMIPVRFLQDGSNCVKKMELVKVNMRGAVAVPVEGSAVSVDVDRVLVAVGETPTPPVSDGCCGIRLSGEKPVVDSNFMTTKEGVFAAGDVVTGPSNIGNALFNGLQVARKVDQYLSTRK